MSDPFEYDQTKSGLLAELVQQGLAMNVATSDSIEAPYGPTDVMQTGDIELMPAVESSFGLVALIDGDSEL